MTSRDMEVVQQFNAELSSLYEVRPPISKAKMSQITRVSMKAIKMYKHIVQSVERFIIKCRPEYKIPGLYVIDSIVRQSRHQFGADKDVYAARFARNFAQTFQSLFLTCPPDDKPKIVRVLNLWQRNNVFTAETIQPLLDMANPNASLSQMKFDSSPQNSSRDANRDNRDNSSQMKDPNLLLQLQQLANSLGLNKSGNNSSDSQQTSQNQIKFNKKLLDFDYGDEEDEEERGETPTEAEPPIRSGSVEDNSVNNPLALSVAQNLLSNPELLQQLQQMQKSMQQSDLLNFEGQGSTGLGQSSSGQQFLSAFQSQPQHQQQNHSIISSDANNNSDESRKQIDLNMNFENLEQKLNNNDSNQLNPNLNANENSFQYLQNANNFGPQMRANDMSYGVNNNLIDATNQYHNQQQSQPFHQPFAQEVNERSGSHSPRNRSPRRQRFGRDRYRDRSRSPRDRSRRDRDGRRYRSRSRSPRNSRFNDRPRSPQSYERERERERRRKGLPPIRKTCLTICSTTLWLGHVPKLVSEADLSDTFGEFGAITSIDLIPSRGCAYVCMNRRQDAAKALNSLRSLKLHGSQIKMAWAPGKGMKDKEYKDYWEAEEGASYIPYAKIPEDVDLDLLEEGGTVDEDTMPENLQETRKRKIKEKEMEKERETMIRAAAMMMPVGIPPTSFGLVMPNMLNITSQSPAVMASDTTLLTTNSFPHVPAPPLPTPNKEDNYIGNQSEITEVTMTSDANQNELKSDANAITSKANVPLLPPPLPPFQTAVSALSLPPMPPLLANQATSQMPWLSGPPPPIIPGTAPQRPSLIPLSSVPTSATDSTISSIRNTDLPSSTSKPEERPPLIGTLPLPIPHDDLPPRLHPDRAMDRPFGARDRFRPNMDRPDMDRSHHNDDPFAPSVYELRAMERNQMMRPPIPHQMGAAGRSGLMPIPHNMNERFPFERPQRPYHPRHHNMRPDIRHHHNFERHPNHPGRGRDQFPNRGFGRRDRPSRWKSDDNPNRHYNRNNNNDYNSGFNKFERRHDRDDRDSRSEGQLDSDSNRDSIGDNTNGSANDNEFNISANSESNFSEVNNDFKTESNRNNESNVETNDKVSESVDTCVKQEMTGEET